MPVPNPTVDELVTTLQRSQLPTVVVEGKDDMRIYRWIEERIGTIKANVYPVGNKNKLLRVYKRRNEYAHLPIAFVADRDMWLFSRIPSCYHGIIWTQGYSIENDLYAGAELENLLNAEEAEEHQQVLNSIIEWFTFEVEEYLAGRDPQVDTHCYTIIPHGETRMDEDFRKSRGFRPPNKELHQQIRKTYQLQLRGKLLFQILVRFLSASNRPIKHSIFALHEIAVKMTPSHELMSKLIREIKQRIAGIHSA